MNQNEWSAVYYSRATGGVSFAKSSSPNRDEVEERFSSSGYVLLVRNPDGSSIWSNQKYLVKIASSEEIERKAKDPNKAISGGKAVYQQTSLFNRQ